MQLVQSCTKVAILRISGLECLFVTIKYKYVSSVKDVDSKPYDVYHQPGNHVVAVSMRLKMLIIKGARGTECNQPKRM
eukprot:scaffold5753_cov78-Skeletonema_dohrnii-CCMP3373.AAC.1